MYRWKWRSGGSREVRPPEHRALAIAKAVILAESSLNNNWTWSNTVLFQLRYLQTIALTTAASIFAVRL